MIVAPHGVWLLTRIDSDAGLQARIPLELGTYLRRHWIANVGWVAGFGGLGYATTATDGMLRVAALVVGILAVAVKYVRLRKAAVVAWLGDVNPAKVVRSGLAVAYADFVLRSGHFPILQTFAVPALHGPGSRIATVCWYYVTDQVARCWSELEPHAVDEFTSNESIISALRDAIPKGPWDALEAGIAAVGDLAGGLYPLPGGDWPDDWVGHPITPRAIEERFGPQPAAL